MTIWTMGLLVAWGLSAPPEAMDTVVVCPPAFRDALEPWITLRSNQGHKVGVLSNEFSLAETRAAIRRAAKSGVLKFVLLVGDAEPHADRQPNVRARSITTTLLPAKVNVKFGSEPEIATDNSLADLDDDGVPDLAIGRLTADSPAELSRIVKKILAYERSTDNGSWRQRVNFVAGVGGFGPLIDTVVETTTKKFLTDCIPATYTTTMTYGSWRSPFCPDPRRFHETALNRLNEGCLFWVYIGHGQPHGLDYVQVPGGAFPIMSTKDVTRLNAAKRAPIAVFLSCYTGAFDRPDDCLAEEMLRAEGGPVAVLAATRVTMPYGMAVLGTALMDECFRKHQPTIGEALLYAKRRTVENDGNDLNRQMLDALAAVLSPSVESLTDERREHLALFNLLGDPLLRIRHPQEVAIEAVQDVDAGTQLDVAANCPIAGRCVIELVCRRDCLRESPPARDKFQATNDALAAYTNTYEQANDQRWGAAVVQLTAPGPFRTKIQIPPDAHGPSHVRIFAENDAGSALGAANVFIRRADSNPAR